MKEQIEIRNLIRTNLDQIKVKNPGFSLRAYAKKLELSPSALSEILNGKRNISARMAAKILDRMNLSAEASAPVLKLFDNKTKNLFFEETGASSGRASGEPLGVSVFTVSANKKNLPKAQRLIKEFQEQLKLCLEEGESDQVIDYTFYFYPLVQNSKPKG